MWISRKEYKRDLLEIQEIQDEISKINGKLKDINSKINDDDYLILISDGRDIRIKTRPYRQIIDDIFNFLGVKYEYKVEKITLEHIKQKIK